MKLKTAILSVVAAILSLSGGVAVASDANGEYGNFGSGTVSCAKFLKEEKEESISYQVQRFWIIGFMTAAGRYNDTQKAFDEVVDAYGMLHLIRDHCDENPLDNLAKAAEWVVEVHLLPKAGYR